MYKHDALAQMLARSEPRVNRDGFPVIENPDAEIVAMRLLAEPPPPEGHPNVLKILGTGVDSLQAYVVLELAYGGDLFGKVKATRGHGLPEGDVRVAMHGILSGVAHMHGRGVAHRDLSLENVLVCHKDRILELKIMDFGQTVALHRDAGGVTVPLPRTTPIGKSLYKAPEVCDMLRAIGICVLHN